MVIVAECLRLLNLICFRWCFLLCCLCLLLWLVVVICYLFAIVFGVVVVGWWFGFALYFVDV